MLQRIASRWMLSVQTSSKDLVVHQKIDFRLENLGLAESLLKWVWDFLIDRRQKVKINPKCTSWKPVFNGATLGSVLRPLIFILYVN